MSHPSSKRITQRDVARAAGVSQALVSQVLSGKALNEANTAFRQSVLDAAERLGYERPARGSAREPRRNLAYLYPAVTRGSHQEEWIYRSYEEFYGRKRMLLEEAAQKAGFVLMAHPVTQGDAELTRWLSEWEIEGVFLHSGGAQLGRWVHDRLPVVQFDRCQLAEVDAVATNIYRTVELAMQHLLEQGHRRIGFISKYPLTDHHSRVRRHAYADFAEDFGLPVFDLNTFCSGEAWLERAVEYFLQQGTERVTALIAPDHHALLLQQRLLKAGWKLPHDLSMVGIDNISVSDFSSPRLTSVDGNAPAAAEQAVALMQARLDEPDRGVIKVEVTPQLVVRDSVFTLSPVAACDGITLVRQS